MEDVHARERLESKCKYFDGVETAAGPTTVGQVAETIDRLGQSRGERSEGVAQLARYLEHHHPQMDLPLLLYVCYFEPCLRKRAVTGGIRQLVSGFLAGVQNAVVATAAAGGGSKSLLLSLE
jgi:hypothetical protein